MFHVSSNQCIREFQLFQGKITTLLSQDTGNSRLSSNFHHLGLSMSVKNFSPGEKKNNNPKWFQTVAEANEKKCFK